MIALSRSTERQSITTAVLTDILGDEDHLGDMDFKVTGTADGITACQMDIKIKGLKYEILVEALNQAKKGRLHILDKLDSSLDKPNETVKPHAPKMVTMEIAKDFIGMVIGPGGKNIQELQKESDTTIVINEKDEVGVIEILGVDQEKIDLKAFTPEEFWTMLNPFASTKTEDDSMDLSKKVNSPTIP